ncbi:N-acetylglucosamine-6-phosphate deacetylase [Propionibacteriaceae bacterium Y2011]|uniref:N-acetylglucosamine-6-phosphate deacetylase n=1 Tax=Microlunatus sp. Y2014 TaxID=3418488 RepID=UPI003B473592
MIIDADRVVRGDGSPVAPARLTVTDGMITDIGPLPSGSDVTVQGIVVPGFVDTHVHAGGGGDFATTDPEMARRALALHRRHGTTSVLASLVTDEIDVLVDQLTMLRGLCRTGEVAGIHLEGPFLSEARCGAHPPALLRAPDPASVERLLVAGGDDLAMITMAPELPGAIEAIRTIVAAGVRVAVGHTAADVSVVRQALDAGATVATHLFNAMNPIHHREPGPVPLLLTDDRVAVELVCDGFHVAPEVLGMAVAAAGADRTILITDAMAAAGMPDGRYPLGTLEAVVVDGQVRLVTEDGTPGSIAGSTLTLDRAVRLVVERLGVDLVDAVTMATATPARVHGLTGVGRLAVGHRADLVVLTDDLAVDAVMRGGEWQPTSERIQP